MKKHKTLKNTILYSSIAFSLALTPNTLCAKSLNAKSHSCGAYRQTIGST